MPYRTVCPRCGIRAVGFITYGSDELLAQREGDIEAPGSEWERPAAKCTECGWAGPDLDNTPLATARPTWALPERLWGKPLWPLVSVPDPSAPVLEIWLFALTHRGYGHWLSTEERMRGTELRFIWLPHRGEYMKSGELPSDLDLLRGGLFLEHCRYRIRGWDCAAHRPPAEWMDSADEQLLRDLVGRIKRISLGRVEWQPNYK